MRVSGEIEHFHYFNSETSFLKNENLFWKTGEQFLVESTVMKSATFPYKAALSKVHNKKNRMESTKWTYHKEEDFATN